MSSHGAATSDKCEPNLIPMLDLVLQLVMFFMICANFVMEQVNETIKLPEAIAAKPLENKDDYIIFLNVNSKGQVLLSALDAIDGEDVLSNPKQVEFYMKKRYEEDIRGAGGDRSKPPRSLIIIRADKETPFDQVYGIMKACRLAGYERAQLRTLVGDAREG